MCVICCDEERPINYTMKCKHSFHTNCLIRWWANQEMRERCVSCPLCRYKPWNDEIEHLRLVSASNAWIKHAALGEDKFKTWIERVKRATYITPMENVLNAPEYLPNGAV